MAMKRPLSVCILVAGLAGCAGTPEFIDVRNIENPVAKGFTSREPASCTTADVDLSNAEVLQFFRRAVQVPYRQFRDDYPHAPCQLDGSLSYRGQPCGWTISAAGTGRVICGETTWYFACDDCEDLLVH